MEVSKQQFENALRNIETLKRELAFLSIDNARLKQRIETLETQASNYEQLYPEVDMSRQLKKYIPGSRINVGVSGLGPQVFDADTRETWYCTSNSNAQEAGVEPGLASERVKLGEVKKIRVLQNLFWAPIDNDYVPDAYRRPDIMVGEYVDFHVRDGHVFSKIGSFWDIIFEGVRCGDNEVGSNGYDV